MATLTKPSPKPKDAPVSQLLGYIPGRLGFKSRRIFYRGLLKQMGKGVCIQPHVTLMYPHNIELGNWAMLKSYTILDAGDECVITIEDKVTLGHGTYIMGGRVSSKITLKEDVSLDNGVQIKSMKHGHIEIGNGTYVGAYTCISGPGPVKIGKHCLVAAHCGIYGNHHNFDDPTRLIKEQILSSQGITIEDDCWLGTGVKVLDGVTIGKGSIIGASAVVNKNIPPYSIAVGIPAKVISSRFKTEEKTSESANQNFTN